MTISDFFLLIASISLAVVAFITVPALLQIRRTFKKTETLIDTLNNEIGPLARSLKETASELQILSITLNSKVEKTDRIIETVQQSADTLLMSSRMVKDIAVPVMAQIGGLRAGVKAFTNFFTKSS